MLLDPAGATEGSFDELPLEARDGVVEANPLGRRCGIGEENAPRQVGREQIDADFVATRENDAALDDVLSSRTFPGQL